VAHKSGTAIHVANDSKKPANTRAKKPYRGGTGKKPRESFTPQDLLSWVDSISGVSQAETATKLSISRDTVRDGRDRVATFIAQNFDINSYRLPLYAFYTDFLKSVQHNLRKFDVPMTIAYGKGLQIFVDKQVNESEDLANLSNDELIERIQRRLKVASG
jgi:hypothetical protein